MSIARRISALAIATMLLPAAAFAATVAAKPAAAGNAENFWSRPHTVSTHGAVTINGKRIDYSADTGTLILHDKQGKPTGEMFYVAYFKTGRRRQRRELLVAAAHRQHTRRGDHQRQAHRLQRRYRHPDPA